jgi:acyl-coenzyme A thioesterase PaaI-like protein
VCSLSVCPAATLVDTVGTAALLTVGKKSGVSLNININYLNPMPAGEDVEVDARVIKVCSQLEPPD